METSRLIVGSTGSGKSEGELVDLVQIAAERQYAVVLLDGHGPLALRAAGHWEARGFEHRMLYEPLAATDRVLCWSMLRKSAAPTLPQRLLADSETRDELAQCFLSQRNLASLSDKPWTKEWLEAAIRLCLSQPQEESLPSLLAAFQVGSPAYEKLLHDAEDQEVVAKFRAMERIKARNEVQYETQTGAARRLLELTCASEVVRLRARLGPFDWVQALRGKKLIAFDGGGLRSTEVKRTLFLLVSMHVIHAVRRHFAEIQQPLPVVLVLEEAGALGLVTPFLQNALRELRKAGLAIHLLMQSSLDFGDQATFEALLANTPWQAWYLALSPSDQELGAKSLANPTFDPLAVHYTRLRMLPDGIAAVPTVGKEEVSNPQTHQTTRRVRKSGTALLRKYFEVIEEYYKTPQLHEQEFRTSLSTLQIGERFVRDLAGVRRERVIPLGPSRPLGLSEQYARAAIERIRQQPFYLPCLSAPVAPKQELLPAAEVLRSRARDTPGPSAV